MLKQLRLSNFQSHRKTELEFSPNVNVISGSSDAGKSSIIRSLLWVFNNRPPGDIIKNWHSQERDKVAVDVNFSESMSIRKERLKGKSKYIVGDSEFEAIKQDVPEEVSSLANLSEFNIQSQHEPYFFLNDTPGEVARKLNDLVGLNIIDTIFRNLDSKIRGVSSDIRATTSDIANLKEEIENLSYVDTLYDEVVDLEKDVEKLTTLEKEADALNSLILSLQIIITELGTYMIPFEAESQVEELLGEIRVFKDDEEDYHALKKIIGSLVDIGCDLGVEKGWLECEPFHTKLNDLIRDYESLQTNILTLERSLRIVQNETKAHEFEVNKLDGFKKEYVKKLRLAKICPICQSQITLSTIKTIEESL